MTDIPGQDNEQRNWYIERHKIRLSSCYVELVSISFATMQIIQFTFEITIGMEVAIIWIKVGNQ